MKQQRNFIGCPIKEQSSFYEASAPDYWKTLCIENRIKAVVLNLFAEGGQIDFVREPH